MNIFGAMLNSRGTNEEAQFADFTLIGVSKRNTTKDNDGKGWRDEEWTAKSFRALAEFRKGGK